MRKRLVLAGLCILILPLLFSLPQNSKISNPAPFAGVALAGRTLGGSYCDCGCPACICGEGEQPQPCIQGAGAQADSGGDDFNQVAAPLESEPVMFDFGSSALIVALAFFAWARFRGTSL